MMDGFFGFLSYIGAVTATIGILKANRELRWLHVEGSQSRHVSDAWETG